jgi:hypothetical protein
MKQMPTDVVTTGSLGPVAKGWSTGSLVVVSVMPGIKWKKEGHRIGNSFNI